MTDTITLHGFIVSPHVRAARLAFAEKGVAIVMKEIGPDDLRSDTYGRINPFRKMPILTHGALSLYETPALMIYADGMGGGASLVPSELVERARMFQFIGIAQNYLHNVGVMQLYFHTVLARLFGMEPNEDVARGSVAPTTTHLDVLEERLSTGQFLAGPGLSLADLYCGAMVDYIARTRDGRALVEARPALGSWLRALRARASFATTLAPMLAGTDQV